MTKVTLIRCLWTAKAAQELLSAGGYVEKRRPASGWSSRCGICAGCRGRGADLLQYFGEENAPRGADRG